MDWLVPPAAPSPQIGRGGLVSCPNHPAGRGDLFPRPPQVATHPCILCLAQLQMSNITCVGCWGNVSVWGHPDGTALKKYVGQVMPNGDTKKIRPACAIDLGTLESLPKASGKWDESPSKFHPF